MPAIEAVVLLRNDDIHSVQDVTYALEALGIAAPQALLATSQINLFDQNVVSKGGMQQMKHVAQVLSATGLNATWLATSEVDAAVTPALPAAFGAASPWLEVCRDLTRS